MTALEKYINSGKPREFTLEYKGYAVLYINDQYFEVINDDIDYYEQYCDYRTVAFWSKHDNPLDFYFPEFNNKTFRELLAESDANALLVH